MASPQEATIAYDGGSAGYTIAYCICILCHTFTMYNGSSLPGSCNVSKNFLQRSRYGHFKLLYTSSTNCPGSNDLGDGRVGSSTGFAKGIDSITEAFTFDLDSGIETDLDGFVSVNTLGDVIGAAE